MLTSLQLARVRFHLGYPDIEPESTVIEIAGNVNFTQLTPSQLLALVGDRAALQQSFLGTDLATPDSLLGNLEVAFSNLLPTKIDDSLFVQSAGSVALRRDELRARKALYKNLTRTLKTLLGVCQGKEGGPSYHY